MIKLKPKQRCLKCKMLYWKKHKCRKDNSQESFNKVGIIKTRTAPDIQTNCPLGETTGDFEE